MTQVKHQFASAVTSFRQQRKPGTYVLGLFRRCSALLLLSVLLPFTSLSARATGSEPQGLRLIELYTSHGCSSCPAADALLGKMLAEDDRLLALEFHVDYWNTLVHGNDGSFTDPFSSASHSERQRQYNAANLSGRPGVYTPQAIVNGRFATVGSNRRHIDKALAKVVEPVFDVQISDDGDQGGLSVVITGSEQRREALQGTDIVLVRYKDKVETQITGGENNGQTLTNHHVVSALTLLGEVSDQGAMKYSIDKPGEAEGCVVLIQEDALTPIYAVAACP